MPTAPRQALNESRPSVAPLSLSATRGFDGPNGKAARGFPRECARRPHSSLLLSPADTLGWSRDEWLERNAWRGEEEDVARDRRNAGIDRNPRANRIEWNPAPGPDPKTK
jgi:hypothetical protein